MSDIQLASVELARHPARADSWVGSGALAGAAPAAGDGWNGPADCFRALYRRKGTLLLVTLSCVLLAAGISAVEPRMFRSVASLEVQGVNDNFLNLRDVDPSAAPGAGAVEPYVKTQAEILQQDGLIRQVVEKLNLQKRAEYRPKTGWRGKLSGEPAASEQYAMDAVRKHLTIKPSADSQIVSIAFEGPDPRVAADFVNAMAQAAIDESVEARRRVAQQIQEFLRPRIEELKQKVQNSESALDAYTRSSGLILTQGQDTLAAEKLRTLQDELSKAQADRIVKQSQYEQLSNNPVDTMAENGAVREYNVKLTDLRRQLADLSSILQPQSYKVVRLNAQIAQLEAAVQRETKRLNRALENDYLAARRREQGVAAACARQSAVVSQMTGKVTQYNTLKQEVDSNRQFYEAMRQKANDAGIASAVRQSNIRLIAPAEPALFPFKPNIPLNLSIGLAAGLLLATACVILSEQSNSRLRVPGEASVYLNIPELGTIPDARCLQPAFRRMIEPGKEGVERITFDQQFSELSEAFRGAVASLISAEQAGDRQDVLVVTSSLAGEGKTTVASNLAIALAEISSGVLLIDGDMRRPRVHKVFGLPNSWGLSDILGEQNASEELPLDVLTKKTSVPRLRILPSGPSTASIFSLLYSKRMDRLIRRFRREFDYVIVDAPPCLEFADARILARHATGVLLVVRADYADRKTALAAVQRFFLDGVPVVGTVLNHWDPINWGGTYGYSAYRGRHQKDS